jgi:hypothetical protein
MLTRRQNLQRIVRGERPQWVPFALNFAQWYLHHRQFGTLPEELRGCADYISAMKALECDIFTRNVEGGQRIVDTKVTARISMISASTGPRTTTLYETPVGSLRHVSQSQTKLTCVHDEEYLVKDWKRDGDAFRYLLDQRQWLWEEAIFQKTAKQVGDWGIVNVPFACTPLKFLHLYFGLEYSCIFLADFPEVARELCEIYWAKIYPGLRKLAEHPDVESVILMDNVDTPFYPPVIAQWAWQPYVRSAAELMRRQGKLLFVHACGKLALLNDVIARSSVSGLEGIAHPPLGDWPASAAQKCHPRFIFIGGFTAREQDLMSDQQMRDFYAEYLSGVDRDRFIFSSSCNTSVHTPWQRIKLLRDIVRQWGGSPPEGNHHE